VFYTVKEFTSRKYFKIRSFSFLFILCSLLNISPVLALDMGLTVIRIEIEDSRGAPRHSDLIKSLSSRQGEFFLLKNIKSDASFIEKETGIRVSPEFDVVPGGIEIKFVLIEKKKISEVRIIKLDNSMEFPKLKEKLLSKEGMIFTEAMLEADKNTITGFYKEKGFIDIKINEVTVLLDEDGFVVEFFISNGRDPYRVGEIKFHGNRFIKTGKLKKEIKVNSRSDWIPFFKRPVFNEPEYLKDPDRIHAYYVASGYYDAEVKASYARNEKNLRVDIDYFINEGKRYFYRNILFDGNKNLSMDEFKKLFQREILNKPALTRHRVNLMRLIEKKYHEAGFIQLKHGYEFLKKSETLIFKIQEGAPQILNEYRVTGLERLKSDRIIIEEMSVMPGSVINLVKIKSDLSRLMKKAKIADIKIDYEKNMYNSGTVVLRVIEKKPTEVKFGNKKLISFDGRVYIRAGYGVYSGPTIGIGYINNNFIRTGNSLRVKLLTGLSDNYASVSYKDNYLGATDLSGESKLWYSDSEWVDYDRTVFGGELIAGRDMEDLLKGLWMGCGYRIRHINIDDVDPQVDHELKAEEGDKLIHAIIMRARLNREERDMDGHISGGYRIRFYLEPSYADSFYLKTRGTINFHKTAYKNEAGDNYTFHTKISLGMVTGGPVFEKYYAGGVYSIRGVKSRSTSEDDRGIGGSFVLELSEEFEFPIFSDSLNGVIFVDEASVGDFSSLLTDINLSVGAGLKITKFSRTAGEIEFGAGFPVILNSGSKDYFYMRFGNPDYFRW